MQQSRLFTWLSFASAYLSKVAHFSVGLNKVVPYQLMPTPIQADLAQAAIDIGESVASGDINGLAVVVATKNRRFFVDVFGTLARDPHATRGFLASLDDCLRDIGLRKKDRATTL